MSGRKAFTLVEILVVIGIIALLMAMLLPALEKANNQAKTAICQSNLQQWNEIWNIFFNDTDGTFGHSDYYSYPGNEPFWWYDYYIPRQIKGIRACPMAEEIADPTGQNIMASSGGKLLSWGRFGATGTKDYDMHGSYGLVGYSRHWYDLTGPNVWKTTDVKSPGHVPLWFDCGSPTFCLNENLPPPSSELIVTSSCIIDRHNGYVNFLFLDFSVRKVGLKELWTLKWHPDCNTAGPWTSAGGVQPSYWPPWMRKFKDY
jgi:prepilin-type N-terminal cleavage/methylation domain-containing protein/prepilin-type processing-associated H-X9-DG protein